MSLKNFVSMTDHFNFILLADVVFFFLCRFIQSQRSMTRMLIAVPRPSLMLIPVTGLINESLCRSVRKLSEMRNEKEAEPC